MGNLTTGFFDSLAAGATWSAGVAFQRSKGLPLDKYSVFASKTLAEEYAGKTGAYAETPVSYPGQVIAVQEGTKMVAYVLAENAEGTSLELQQIGIIPTGDEKTIDVTEEGKVSLLGAEDAANGTLPMIGDDGKLTWKTLEDIGAGDGNDVVTYTFAGNVTTVVPGAGQKRELKIQKYLNGQIDGDIQTIEIGYTTADIDAKFAAVAEEIGVASQEESAEGAGDAVTATGLYKLIEDETARATAAEGTLAAKIGEAATADTEATGVYAYVDGEIDALEEAISNLNHFTTKIVESVDEVTEYGILYLIKDTTVTGEDKYNEYLFVDEAAVLIGDTTTDLSDYYTKEEVDGIETLLLNRITALEGIDNATQAELDAYKEEVTAALGDKADKATTLAGYGITDAYTATETDAAIAAKIKEMTGGESAADVLSVLNDYKKANDREIYGNEYVTEHTVDGTYTPDYSTATSRIDALEAVGAQANVIESVIAAEGAKITATKSGKEVTIDDSALVALIAAAQSKAEQGVADAAAAASAASTAQATANTNADNITALTGRMTTAESKINENAGAIASHATEFATLKGRVDAHDTTLTEKADKSVVDGINTTVAGHTTELAGLTSRLTTAEGTLANKADASSVYTKTEIGTIEEDETIVSMIENAKYNDTAIKASIEAIYKAGEGETPASGVLADEIARATAAEKLNSDAIAALAEQIGNVSNIMNFRGVVTATDAGFEADVATITDPKDGDVILYREQEYVYSGGWVLFGDASGNASAITALDTRVTQLEVDVPAALQAAKDYADGLDKGVMSVVSGHEALVINTDETGKVTIGFADEIVLNGGKA